MRLIALLVIRDDADVAAAYVRHHLRQGFDGFAIVEHRSDPAVLATALEGTGADTIVIRRETAGFPQGRWTSELAEIARTELDADWVFPLDADEFLVPVRLPDVRTVVEHLPPSVESLELRRYNMVPPLRRQPFPSGFRTRLRTEVNFNGNPLPPKIAARAVPGIAISEGNHAVTGVRPAAGRCDHLEILHAPFRSWLQFETKVAVGAQALRLTPELPAGVGSHWRQLDEQRNDRRTLRRALPKLAITVRERARARLAGELVRDDRLEAALRP